MAIDKVLPYLSVVVPSRNDDYNGGALRRLQVCVSDFITQAERHRLASELILVDWNPPLDRPKLREVLQWPESTHSCSVRVIEVPGEVHATLTFSDKLPMLIHRARNVGIRRARGRFAVPITTDVLFSDTLMRFLAAEKMETGRMYRTERDDVPEEVLDLASLEERLAFCDKNVVYVRRSDTLDARLLTKASEAAEYSLGAPGDFTLLSKESWLTLHGVPEETEFQAACFDNVLCYMALAAGLIDSVLRNPIRLYHINHPSAIDRPLRFEALKLLAKPYKVLRRLAPERVSTLARRLGRLVYKNSHLEALGVPRISSAKYWQIIHSILEGERGPSYNDSSWGLANDTLPESTVVRAKWEGVL